MDPQVGLIARLVSLALLLACEPLRPVVEAPAEETREEELASALELLHSGWDLPRATPLLRQVMAESQDEEERERARRLLAQAHVEWFQVAHIAHDLLPRLPGYNRLFNTLLIDLEKAPIDAPPAAEPDRTTPPELVFLAPLVGEGETGASPNTVKRHLQAELGKLEQSPELSTRSFATAARLLLNIDSAWRYSRRWRAPPGRVRDLLDFIRRPDASGLRDNAWLILKLSFELALDEPQLPSRPLVDAVAALTGVTIPASARTALELLEPFGAAVGPSLPERLYRAWLTMRQKVDDVLDRQASSLTSGDGARAWSRLADYLELHGPPAEATPAALFAFGEPMRTAAVRDWLNQQALAPLTTAAALNAFETRLRKRWISADRRPALLVIGALGVLEAVALRLGDRVRGRALKLLDRGDFESRSLILPGGTVYTAFPKAVSECIQVPANGCLRRLVDDLVTQGEAGPAPRPAPRRRKPVRRPTR